MRLMILIGLIFLWGCAPSVVQKTSSPKESNGIIEVYPPRDDLFRIQWYIIDNWLREDDSGRGDYNSDGICNFIDYADFVYPDP